MLSRFPAILAALSLAGAVVPSTVHAECVRVVSRSLLDNPDAELVFAGKVVQVTSTGDYGLRATFDVDRVWRGKVPKRFDVYVWYLASAEAPRYSKGESYVVAAMRLSDKRARQGVGLGDSDVVAFTGVPCSDGWKVEDLDRLSGPGKPPVDESAQRKINR
jgi:hypothetical protein